jgi:hypothetical protein
MADARDPRPGGRRKRLDPALLRPRGVVRRYEMTFDGREWTLLRRAPDFSPLDFHQRYVGTFSDDGDTIDGQWEASDDGTGWRKDFRLTYRRVR